jgi:hypothetical protein
MRNMGTYDVYYSLNDTTVNTSSSAKLSAGREITLTGNAHNPLRKVRLRAKDASVSVTYSGSERP